MGDGPVAFPLARERCRSGVRPSMRWQHAGRDRPRDGRRRCRGRGVRPPGLPAVLAAAVVERPGDDFWGRFSGPVPPRGPPSALRAGRANSPGPRCYSDVISGPKAGRCQRPTLQPGVRRCREIRSSHNARWNRRRSGAGLPSRRGLPAKCHAQPGANGGDALNAPLPIRLCDALTCIRASNLDDYGSTDVK
jgi:hypothetical protein